MRKLLVMASTLALSAPALAQEDLVNPVNSVQVVAGVGFGGFTSTLGDGSNVGVAWTARAGMDFLRYFGGELNYQGQSSSTVTFITPTGTLSGSHVTEDQITANAKAGFPFMVADRVLEPYVIAGIGYGHIGVDSSLAPVGLNSQDAAVFPFGAGMSYNITPILLVDARYTYNVLTEGSGDTWNVGFNVGAKFGL